MSDKKSIKEELKDLFLSGELSVEVIKEIGECEYDYCYVAVKVDNVIVCQKGEYVKTIAKPIKRDPNQRYTSYNV